MIGRFIIWVEDEYGSISRVLTWRGIVADGIERAKADALSRGVKIADIWATPLANYNRKRT